MYSHFYTLITGASEGLGRELAIVCAQRKMNLVLVALPGPGLHTLAETIRYTYDVEVIPIEKDLSQDGNYTDLFHEVNALELKVNMLINNAGTGSTLYFGEGSAALYEQQIKLNVLATTLITRSFLEMLKKNGPSHILNVGSLASFFHLPKKAVYGATKSYIHFFSKCLFNELRKDRIHVCELCPGGMQTNPDVCKMNKAGNILLRRSVMNPKKVATIAIEGLLKKRKVIVPGRLNRLFMLLNFILPEFIKSTAITNCIKKMSSKEQVSNCRHKPISREGVNRAA